MKQCTNNRGRRLTRAEKVIVTRAGQDPRQYLYAGEVADHLILRDKATGSMVYVTKEQKVKRTAGGGGGQANADTK